MNVWWSIWPNDIMMFIIVCSFATRNYTPNNKTIAHLSKNEKYNKEICKRNKNKNLYLVIIMWSRDSLEFFTTFDSWSQLT